MTETLGRMLIDVEKLDVGQAKILRIKSYVRRCFQLGIEDKINLQSLCKKSRDEIVHERINLRK